jgi:flagellar hook-associated protein FlgK
MSDVKVRATLEQMEAWLAEPSWEPDAEALARWNKAFLSAMAQAGKEPGWSDLITKAHELGRQLELRADRLAQQRDQVMSELEGQARGARALKSYRANTL